MTKTKMKKFTKLNFYLIFSVIFVAIFCLSILSVVSAASATVSKLGNAFSSTTGSYATASHCTAGSTCGWISGNQIIVGAYSGDPNTWAGSATWNFDLSSVNLNNLQSAVITISWPATAGKGLHSTINTGQGIITINGNVLRTLTTNVAQLGDWFAHNPYVYSLSYDVPASSLLSSTNIKLETTSRTAWDIAEIKLVLTERTPSGFIQNGKFIINGAEFIVKGMDYAPWIPGTGPDPTPGLGQAPFPNEYDDVTNRMSNVGIISVRDYSGDGIIQAWEVIQYDLEKMKAVGVNTVRTYSSGVWHDKNLNGVADSGENSQGDLPDWIYDRVLAYANANNMKVIIGYWVQEENFASGMVCDWSDLEVAKQAFGRIVNKYKNNNAVLAWAIGNEVNGAFNHQWFSWGVDINSYLNAFNSYVKTLDANHPIIYSKYVGENTNFNNLNADVIAVNSYTNPAENLNGEFSIPAPQGKAYMLGEFGHLTNQADSHWNLAVQYAGGCFLEHNDVWWKTGTQVGIVTKYREVKAERYNKVLSLYNINNANIWMWSDKFKQSNGWTRFGWQWFPSDSWFSYSNGWAWSYVNQNFIWAPNLAAFFGGANAWYPVAGSWWYITTDGWAYKIPAPSSGSKSATPTMNIGSKPSGTIPARK